MVKLENASFPMPDVPPGFEPLRPKTRTAAVVESSRKQNPTPNGNGVFTGHEHAQSSDSSAEQGPRRTQRKRSRPEFYEPPTRRRTAASPLRRARTARGKSAETPRRRGRPPKARFMSLFSLPEPEAQNRRSNEVSSTPLTRLQGQGGQGQLPYFIKPVQLTKEQSSSQPKINTSSTPNDPLGHEPNINGKTREINVDGSINRSNFFQARDIEETVVERSKNVGCTNKMTEGIDPKLLQHVANALQYMTVSQTSIEYENVYSRSSDFDKNLVRTIKAIEKMHGDITKNCLLESDCMKTLVLIGICQVVQDMQKKRLKDVDISSLESHYTAVRDAENMKVNVQWLRNRLDEIKDAVSLSSEAIGIENERNGLLVTIDRKKSELLLRRVELERLKSEVEDIEEQIAREAVMVDELNKKYGDSMSRISEFQKMNLMDGLV
ncbi:hypothetical protein ACS0TY_022200 [Phlomoides rotata]